jgi:hypothetical protein
MAEFTIFTRSYSSAWIPELIAAAGREVTENYIDFFTSTIRNRNTRAAYARACWQFFEWCAAHGLELMTVRPFHVAAWIEDFPGSKPTIKQKSPRCGCCAIFWSFGRLHDRIRRLSGSGPRPRVFSPRRMSHLRAIGMSFIPPFWYELNEVGRAQSEFGSCKAARADRLLLCFGPSCGLLVSHRNDSCHSQI